MPIPGGRDTTRTGRFTADGSAAINLTLIRAGTGVLRVHNSGEHPFTVLPKGAGTVAGDQVTLAKKSSVDVKLVGQNVLITAAAGNPIDGIYEYVDANYTGRSGHFKGDAGASAIIVQDRPNHPYRILNSSKPNIDLTVTIDGASAGTVKPRQSLDVIAGADRVVITAGAGQKFQGIYDFLHKRSSSVRSGRFKIKVNPQTAVPIINRTNHTESEVALYRIFNSGDHVIQILEGGTQIHELNADQSFDLRVAATQIAVRSAANNQPIEGIYDFLEQR
jgi:hypothetical protein